jgi:hypothetical protein
MAKKAGKYGESKKMVKLEKPWPGKKLAQTAEYISTRQKNALAKAEASYGLVQKADKAVEKAYAAYTAEVSKRNKLEQLAEHDWNMAAAFL